VVSRTTESRADVSARTASTPSATSFSASGTVVSARRAASISQASRASSSPIDEAKKGRDNSLFDKPCFGRGGVVDYADLFVLLWDVEQHLV
jgi:hypothetical protein